MQRKSEHRAQAASAEIGELIGLLNAGRLVELEGRARELLARRPDSAMLWKVLGASLGMQGKDAVQALETATTLLPNDAEAHLNLANALRASGRLEAAVAGYRRAIELQPRFALAHCNLGNALRELGQLEPAVHSCRRALEIKPDYAVAYCHLGNALRDLGRHQEAISSYQHAVANKPDYHQAHGALGCLLLQAGQIERAVASCRRATELKPDFAEAHLNLGHGQLAAKRFEEAAASYRRALEIEAACAAAHVGLGNALRFLGQSEAALASYQRALAIEPTYAEAFGNQGNALHDLGRFEEAVASYRRALETRPDFAEAHCNLGNTLRALGQFEAAVASCRRAVELQPDFAEAHNNLGNALRDLGRLAEADASYRRALAIDPNLAEAYNNLGDMLRDRSAIEAAEASLRRAVALAPNYADAHNNLGLVLRAQSRTAEAEESFRTALALEPDSSATIASIAELRADVGAFAEAEELLRRAIALDADAPEAWAQLAGLRRMTAADQEWLAQAERIVAQPLPARREVPLRFALGKYYDDVKDFRQAFAHYQRANELSKAYTPRYDRQRQSRIVDQVISCYDREWISRTQTSHSASARPIFVIGMPRSGTTLVEQILAAHPEAFGAGELHFWHDAVPIGRPEASTLRKCADDYLQLLRRLSPRAQRVIDKMPSNFMHVGAIHAALPNARIIHMRRNPIDTCLSIYFQNFSAAHPHANDLDDLAHFYREYLRLMKHWRATVPQSALLEVPYEELVDQKELWIRKLLEFTGLSWAAACVDFHASGRTVVTASRWQVRQPINKSSVARWRNYEQFLGALVPLLRHEVDDGTGATATTERASGS